MKARKRLYPTVKEERDREVLKNKLGLTRTAISKGGGMLKPNRWRKCVLKSAGRVTDLESVNAKQGLPI